MGPDDVASPDPNEIAPHAIAFVRMMFAHAALEREVRSLVDAINPKEPGFGERPENQWTASESGTGKITILIKQHRGSGLPQTEQIKNLLNAAIHPCRDRNFLAHGTWCCFNRRTLTVEVRGEVPWGQSSLSPETRSYTVSDILKVARKLREIEAELYRVRRSLEPKMSEAEMRAASSILKGIEARGIAPTLAKLPELLRKS
jgi:hypothetical protein